MPGTFLPSPGQAEMTGLDEEKHLCSCLNLFFAGRPLACGLLPLAQQWLDFKTLNWQHFLVYVSSQTHCLVFEKCWLAIESLKQNVEEHFMWHRLLNTTAYAVWKQIYWWSVQVSVYPSVIFYMIRLEKTFSESEISQSAGFQKKHESLVGRSWA